MSDLDLAPMGTYLPRPIIDRVEVYDKYLTITLSIYLTSPDGSDTATLLEDLEKLNYYLFYAMDTTTIQNLIEKKETIFSGITNVNPSSRPILLAPRDTEYFNVNYHNSQKIASGFGTEADGSNSQWLLKETAGDNDAGFTYKYSTTIDHYFGVEPNHDASYFPYNFVDLESGASVWADLSSEYANIMLFTFSSTIDLGEPLNSAAKAFRTYDPSADQFPIFKDGVAWNADETESANRSAFYTATYPTVLGQASADQYLPDVLIDTQTSEVSYMSVFKDGKLDTNLMNVYVTTDGARYETSPLKSLDARYYPTDRVGPDDITATMTELLSRYEGVRSQDSQLDNMMDSIYYVLGAHTDSVDFLGQLAALLKVWPSRVASRPIGRLFNEYQQTIGALNAALKTSGALRRQISQNFKVIDKRGVVVADINEYNADNLPWVSASTSALPEWVYGQADSHGTLDENRYIFNQENNFLVSRQVYSDKNDTAHAMNWGFFFIDYEKALYTQTVLARVLDLGRVESWFGKGISNYGLQWQTVEINKKDITSAGPFISSMGSIKWYDPGDTAYSPFPFVTNKVEDYTGMIPARQSGFYPVTDDGFTQEGLDYSALYPRSFNFARETGLGDYRLACFYFQDYWGGDLDVSGDTINVDTPADVERYEVEASFGDRSAETFLELVAAFAKALTDFNTYHDAAADNCSYNNTDGYFNEFFVTAMSEQYGDDLSQAPWIRMATVYYLWEDLIHNSFGQNYSALIEATKTKIARINPETGTLEGIEAFWQMCNDFWNDYLNLDGSYATDGFSNSGVVAGAFAAAVGGNWSMGMEDYYPGPGHDYIPWIERLEAGGHSGAYRAPFDREMASHSPILPPVFSELYPPEDDAIEEETFVWNYQKSMMFFFDKYLQSDEATELKEDLFNFIASETDWLGQDDVTTMAQEITGWVNDNDQNNDCNPCKKSFSQSRSGGSLGHLKPGSAAEGGAVWIECKLWENPSHGGSDPTHPKGGTRDTYHGNDGPLEVSKETTDPDWTGYITGDYEKGQKKNTDQNKSPDAYVKCWMWRAAPGV